MTRRRILAEVVSGLRRHVALRRSPVIGLWGQRTLPPAPRPVLPQREDGLQRLRDVEIGDCHRCPLGDTRRKLVFGVGNPRARVLVVGEGPGFSEDRQGEPFVGPAGQLLDKILQSIGLSRQPAEPAWTWVYIANVVKCHPILDPTQPDQRGNDRPPTPEEIDRCYPFLQKQIALIQPRYIWALGATAARTLLKTTAGITGLRGRWFDFSVDGASPVRLLPTYHPSALLHNPSLKKFVWDDAKALRAALDQDTAP